MWIPTLIWSYVFVFILEWPLPAEVLPAHYFDDLSDDMDFDIEDDDFLNTTAEMERQYFLNQSKESGEHSSK